MFAGADEFHVVRKKQRDRFAQRAFVVPDQTSRIWCNKVVLLFNASLRCVLFPRRLDSPLLLSTSTLQIYLPHDQGRVTISSSLPRLARAVPFFVSSARPRLRHPCGSFDFQFTFGRVILRSEQQVAILGSGAPLFEDKYLTSLGQWTLAVSECYGRVYETFERRTNELLVQPVSRNLLQGRSSRSPQSRRPKSTRAHEGQDRQVRKKDSKSSRDKNYNSIAFSRGDVHVAKSFLTKEEVARFRAWEQRCDQSIEKSDEKNIGGKCLSTGCVAYCGLWQMAQVAVDGDMSLFLNVTNRVLALVNDPKRWALDVTAFQYTGQVWPHWATFQHYVPGGQHIMHADTDKGEHCVSFAISFSSYDHDFGGGEIQIFQCPSTVQDCGNRGRARTRVPSEGGPFSKRSPNGTIVPLKLGEWLWDGEPEMFYHEHHRLHPNSGQGLLWLSETVHQVLPVTWGRRASLFYWFTCKESLQDQAFDWSGYAEKYL